MLIHWCYKGIPEQPGFGDHEALDVLSHTGIQSAWMLANAHTALERANVAAQAALNVAALDDHVNDFGSIHTASPYISLSAGCREFVSPDLPSARYPALRTALAFATNFGDQPGYVFRCWVVTAPQIAASLPGLADEIRDLNLFPGSTEFHHEGEIAAKLVVPRQQVQWVLKVDEDRRAVPLAGYHRARAHRNPEFVAPRTVSNLIPEIS